MQPLLDVKKLNVKTKTGKELIRNISFELYQEETVGIIGESGSGKSLTAKSIMRILPQDLTCQVEHMTFDQQEIFQMPIDRFHLLRGNELSLIVQNPMTTLNPSLTIGEQIRETILSHQAVHKSQATGMAKDMMRAVNLKDVDRLYHKYAHELSGGMQQRVVIAMALVNHPRMLISDESTTALDVITQAKILSLIKELKNTFKLSVLLISHDIGLIAENCDRVIVMRHGAIVEILPQSQLIDGALHPYTRMLVRSYFSLEQGETPLFSVENESRKLLDPDAGQGLELVELEPGHFVLKGFATTHADHRI